jgi:hypothetical protein
MARTGAQAPGDPGRGYDAVPARRLPGHQHGPDRGGFADKQSLFREIVADTVAEVADPVAQQVASLRASGDLEADLRDLAHALLT